MYDEVLLLASRPRVCRNRVPICVEGEVAANPSPHANVRKTHQNRGPTASGVGNSESTQRTL